MSLTGIGVYTDKQFLDELYVRIKRGAIRLDLVHQTDSSTTVKAVAMGRDSTYGFEAIAYWPAEVDRG